MALAKSHRIDSILKRVTSYSFALANVGTDSPPKCRNIRRYFQIMMSSAIEHSSSITDNKR